MNRMKILMMAAALTLAAGMAEAADTQASTRKKTRSKVIENVCYDQASGTLTVRFRGGPSYAYVHVPAEVYQSMLAAESMGRYYSNEIRGRFTSRRLRAECAKPADQAVDPGMMDWR